MKESLKSNKLLVFELSLYGRAKHDTSLTNEEIVNIENYQTLRYYLQDET